MNGPRGRGRPLYSRIERGYGDDLSSLGRLRQACLADTRIQEKEYLVICASIQKIEKILRMIPKTKLGERDGKS